MCRYMVRAFIVLVCLLAVETVVYGQGAIAGVVKDATDAVLPGVTVEVSSPALLEKSRIATTDERGQYRIIDLRPGVYSVTFTLPGFRPFKREGIELSGAFTAKVDATLVIGGVEESVTVTGESPVVDVKGTLQETVMTREILDEVPGGRNLAGIAQRAPGVQPNRYDVGGIEGMYERSVYAHGSEDSDIVFTFDGMAVNSSLGDGGSIGIYVPDAPFEEVGIRTSSLPADVPYGGVHYNLVMRSGGNDFRGHALFTGANSGMQSDNLTDDLKERGLQYTNSISKIFDVSGIFGGPIVRDKIWFMVSADYRGLDQYAGGVFNPDGSKALEDSRIQDYLARFEFQVTPRNKISAWWQRNNKTVGERRDRSSDYQFIESRASKFQRSPTGYTTGVKFTSALRDTLLFDSGFVVRYLRSVRGPQPEATGIPKNDFVQSTLTGSDLSLLGSITAMYRATGSLTYVTGAHELKAGVQYGWGFAERPNVMPEASDGMLLRFRDGVADSVNVYNTPVYPRNNVDLELGVYVQDSWSTGRLTLNPGVRLDKLVASIPPQTAPAGPWVGERSFPEQRDVPNWTTVVPRFGAVYDLFGNGKTAIKGGASKYVQSQALDIASDLNPMIFTYDRRSWNDLNGDGLAQRNELGPSTGFRGGVTSRMDPDIIRPYNWELTLGVAHELKPGVGVEATYYRRQHRNLIGETNVAVTPNDYTSVTITNPLTGEPLTVYNQSPETRGLRDTVISNQNELDSTYNGVEFRTAARFGNGNRVMGAVTIGRRESGKGGDVNNPNVLINFIGAHPYDATLQIKGQVVYMLPADVQTSVFFQTNTGYPLRRTYTVTRADVPGFTQVTQSVDLVPRGEVRLPRVNLLDVRLTKRFSVGKAAFEPMLDLYNLLNSNPTIREVESIGPNLGRPVLILPARLLKLGVKFSF